MPKLFHCLKEYSGELFVKDLVAGITVGLVALPLAMAFAISSGVAPQAGLATAIVAGFLSSLLGGSRAQVSGPTGAFVVVVGGIVAKYGLDGLHIVTLLAGVMILVLGLTGLGKAIEFIPRPVVIGFTNGIAVLIASTQLKDFFGLSVLHVSTEFLGRMFNLWDARATVDWPTVTVASCSLVVILLFRKFVPRVPWAIVALFGATAAVAWLKLPVDTIGSRFGEIPRGLPRPSLPPFRVELVGVLLGPAVTVALLGSVESLLSAVVSDRMTKDKHDSNTELVAQGVANIVSPVFGGIPSTGAIARTATNVRSGAQTPVAGIVHSLLLLLIVLFAAPLAKYVPMAVLSSILLVVAYNMGEWGEIRGIVRLSKADSAVWLVTFLLTVFADLTVAVQAGMILAALLFITRVSSTTVVTEVDRHYVQEGEEHSLQGKDIPEGVRIVRIQGPFLFGTTSKLEEVLARLDSMPPVVVVRLRNMTAIDATGMQALEDFAQAVADSGRHVLFCGAQKQPRQFMERGGFSEVVGEDNVCPNVDTAIVRANEILAKSTQP
ncbi:MAG: sulfate permease [Armatimonadetes bacterium]|nr:sulfate permease [Armatimonadota bacterium]